MEFLLPLKTCLSSKETNTCLLVMASRQFIGCYVGRDSFLERKNYPRLDASCSNQPMQNL